MTMENKDLPVPDIDSPADTATANNKVSFSGTVAYQGEGDVTIYRDFTQEVLFVIKVKNGVWSDTLLNDLSKGHHSIAATLTHEGEESARSRPRLFKVE